VRVLALALPFSLLACSSLIGLNDFDKAACVDCGAGSSGLPAGGSLVTGGSASGNPAGGTSAGSLSAGGSAGTNANGGVPSVAGTSAVVGGTTSFEVGGQGNENIGGAPPDLDVCPGGPEPPLNWTEHWYEHAEPLTRVHYDACIAVYFDGAVTPAAKDWLIPFLDQAWTYTLSTYGKLGGERLYVVVHQGKHGGGHTAIYAEDTHDHRNVIDMGRDDWATINYDLPAHLMSFAVDFAGAHSVYGSAKYEHYGNEGFPLIYKYDLYVALGLGELAGAALGHFNTLSNGDPYDGTYWFRDWFYPLWRDHGHAKVFADYMTLLEQEAPVDADDWLQTLNYGQYFHFMSGAAGKDLEPLARNAFEWHPDFDEEISSAKEDFPGITY
jgi:hypothetical protein